MTVAPSPNIRHDHLTTDAICIEDLTYRHPDGTLALDDIHLHVQRGVTLAVVGPNGAGKTTLLKILLGLLTDYSGSVIVEGLSPESARNRGLVTWVPQREHLNTNFPLSVFQLARLGLVRKAGLLRGFRKDDVDYLRHVMDVLDLTEIADRPVAHLSGGQTQRSLIARALAPRPQMLLMDEPLVGIDASGQEQFTRLLESIKAEFSVTLVMVSHDLPTMLTRSQRIACLNRSLHFHDSPDKLTSEILSRVFHCSLEGAPTAAPHNHVHGEEHT